MTAHAKSTPHTLAAKSIQSPPRYVVQYSCNSSTAPLNTIGQSTDPCMPARGGMPAVCPVELQPQHARHAKVHAHVHHFVKIRYITQSRGRRLEKRQINHRQDNGKRQRIFLQEIKHGNPVSFCFAPQMYKENPSTPHKPAIFRTRKPECPPTRPDSPGHALSEIIPIFFQQRTRHLPGSYPQNCGRRDKKIAVYKQNSQTFSIFAISVSYS